MLFVLLLVSGVPALATTPSEFYAVQLGRGAAEVQAGRMVEALTPLRLAAFGFVDSIERYETAQVYLAIALDRLNQADLAREAARRVVAAERIERRYASLGLPPAIRTAFEAVARKVLGPSEIASLNQPESVSPQPKPQSSRVPLTTTGQPNRRAGEPTSAQTSGSGPPAAATASRDQERAPAQTSLSASTVSNPPRETPVRPSATPSQPTPQPSLQPTPPAASSTAPPATSPREPAVTRPVTTAATQERKTTPATTSTASPAPGPTSATDSPHPPKPTEKTSQKPAPAPTRAQQSPPPSTEPAAVQTSLAAADRAIRASDLPQARSLYREALGNQVLARQSIIRIGEGLYRARDFSGALAAFRRLGNLKPGEEPYRYYIAVALYESGKLAEARQELKAALPHIEITDDVERYRSKIDGPR